MENTKLASCIHRDDWAKSCAEAISVISRLFQMAISRPTSYRIASPPFRNLLPPVPCPHLPCGASQGCPKMDLTWRECSLQFDSVSAPHSRRFIFSMSTLAAPVRTLPVTQEIMKGELGGGRLGAPQRGRRVLISDHQSGKRARPGPWTGLTFNMHPIKGSRPSSCRSWQK